MRSGLPSHPTSCMGSRHPFGSLASPAPPPSDPGGAQTSLTSSFPELGKEMTLVLFGVSSCGCLARTILDFNPNSFLLR